jgi:hypothetical protein
MEDLQQTEAQTPGESISQDEPQGEQSADWKEETKKFQSMYDKRDADYKRLEGEVGQYRKLGEMLKNRPDVLAAMKSKLTGEQGASTKKNEPKLDEGSFDPWEAYYKPDSDSYKMRVKESQKMVNSAVGQQMARFQTQVGMNNLKGELASNYNMTDPQEQKEFMDFAMRPRDQIPLDMLINVYREHKGQAQQTSGSNENIEAVRRTQDIPKSAGILQGAKPTQKSNADSMWSSVLNADRVGNKIP